MANELDGAKLTFQFCLANPAAATANVLLLSVEGGNSGFVVPAGYKFHPTLISVASNADLTAGSGIAQVTDNGTVVAEGPEATLEDTVQKAAGVCRRGVQPIAAGHVVGVKFTTDAGYLPITADVDAILYGELWPA